MGKTMSYIRVSDSSQKIDRQLEAIKEFNIDDEYIFIDKQSGKDFNRDQYQLMKKILRKDDLLIIKSIDRLGRNYEAMKIEWEDITKNIGADIKVLDMPLLDTQNKKDLLGTFISDLVLEILIFIATDERLRIKSRQMEGIKIALARGTKFGRKKLTKNDLLNNSDFMKGYSLLKSKQITIINLQKMLGLKSRTSVYNWIKLFEDK